MKWETTHMDKGSKITFWCKLMESILLIALLSIPLFNQIAIALQSGDDIKLMGGMLYKECERLSGGAPYTITSAVIVFFGDVIFSIILWQFRQIFKNIRSGKIFTKNQTKRISVSGWCFIALSIYSITINLLISLIQSTDEITNYYITLDDLIYFPVGVGLVICSYVLHLATVMKEEQELVI
ncbi:hypothetical protein BTJ39_09490 [Izhakiella australiensis]|uniref:DUF2975 domain-containing protein n=1 Tax=Izhakiella australiensis TaxID=1926881 RepID=A0A1S8YLY6_9GAMM|nr:DUF2975 domain-containing protein [Izhakiella australiensis]OON40121.1 hypothetical protein BTJ39_09490 [Izhakiella australiensis]